MDPAKIDALDARDSWRDFGKVDAYSGGRARERLPAQVTDIVSRMCKMYVVIICSRTDDCFRK